MRLQGAGALIQELHLSNDSRTSELPEQDYKVRV